MPTNFFNDAHTPWMSHSIFSRQAGAIFRKSIFSSSNSVGSSICFAVPIQLFPNALPFSPPSAVAVVSASMSGPTCRRLGFRALVTSLTYFRFCTSKHIARRLKFPPPPLIPLLLLFPRLLFCPFLSDVPFPV